MPASGNAGGAARSLPVRRLSRGRWRVIDYAREQADDEQLRAAERALSAINEYARRLENPHMFDAVKPFDANGAASNKPRLAQTKPHLMFSRTRSEELSAKPRFGTGSKLCR